MLLSDDLFYQSAASHLYHLLMYFFKIRQWNNSYITIIKEKRIALSRKHVPLNQNECTADFRIGVPFEQNLQSNTPYQILFMFHILTAVYNRLVIFLNPQILKTISGLSNTLPAIFDCLSWTIADAGHTVRTMLSPYRFLIFHCHIV